MVLHLAVENNWGGGDSRRKATLMLEEVLSLFQPNARGTFKRKTPDQYVSLPLSISLATYLSTPRFVGR